MFKTVRPGDLLMVARTFKTVRPGDLMVARGSTVLARAGKPLVTRWAAVLTCHLSANSSCILDPFKLHTGTQFVEFSLE